MISQIIFPVASKLHVLQVKVVAIYRCRHTCTLYVRLINSTFRTIHDTTKANTPAILCFIQARKRRSWQRRRRRKSSTLASRLAPGDTTRFDGVNAVTRPPSGADRANAQHAGPEKTDVGDGRCRPEISQASATDEHAFS